jgi:hypothetical protein
MGPTGCGQDRPRDRARGALPARDRERGCRHGLSRHGHRHGQASRELLARAPHHLIDLIDPLESYSAARFPGRRGQATKAIRARGRTPLFVGGTMLYFRRAAVRPGALPAADPAIRQRIEERAGSGAGLRCTPSSRGSIRRRRPDPAETTASASSARSK